MTDSLITSYFLPLTSYHLLITYCHLPLTPYPLLLTTDSSQVGGVVVTDSVIGYPFPSASVGLAFLAEVYTCT